MSTEGRNSDDSRTEIGRKSDDRATMPTEAAERGRWISRDSLMAPLAGSAMPGGGGKRRHSSIGWMAHEMRFSAMLV